MRNTESSLDLDLKPGNGFTTPEEYGIPRSSAKLKLTPLDMNMPRLYGTRWILCFPLRPDTDSGKIYHNLKEGLANTVASIPWIAGNIGPEEGRDTSENRIQVLDSFGGVKFLSKTLTGVLPSYSALKKANFPLSSLSTSDLSPLGVMPEPPQPVMAAQANFIEGGLLLTIGIHHSVSDAVGFDTIIDTWARNTAAVNSSNQFSGFDKPSCDRRPLMAGIPGANLADFPQYILMPTPRQDTADVNTHQMASTPFQLPPMSARIFRFSTESLAEMKSAAAAYSTNDALSAFLWRHISLARFPSSGSEPADGNKTSALLFAVNIRSRTSPPLTQSYFGNASIACITKRLPISALTSATGLRQAVAAIRDSLSALHIPNRVALTIGLIDSRPDPTDYKFAYHGFLGPDLSATSWADLRVFESDWGILGKPEYFRVPGEGADGAVMVLPRLKDGGLEVVVNLELKAMERLLEDAEFSKAATLWG